MICSFSLTSFTLMVVSQFFGDDFQFKSWTLVICDSYLIKISHPNVYSFDIIWKTYKLIKFAILSMGMYVGKWLYPRKKTCILDGVLAITGKHIK